jgi:ribosomal protein S18 acetylase RimI-like enzyme
MPTLRSAHESDLDRLVQLSVQLAEHDIALGQRRPLRWAADPTDSIAQALRDPTQHHVTVVVDERNDVIGACRTSLMGDEHPCAAHIHDLIIEEPYRSKGLGRALLDDAIEWCAEKGVDEVCLGVAPLSMRSRRFYELSGFEETSILLVRTVRK